MNRRELLEFHNQKVAEKFDGRKEPSRHPEGATTLAEPLVMPNEGEVWVHPLSLEEDAWAVAQAGKEARDLKLSDRNEAEWYVQSRTQVYETIAACRVGPGSTDRVYTKEDAKRLRTDPAYRAKIVQAVEISNRLGQDDFTKDALTGFFEGILEPLERCCSLPNNADCFACSQEILRDLISRLQLTKRRRTLLLAKSEEIEPREQDGESFDDGNGQEIELDPRVGAFMVPQSLDAEAPSFEGPGALVRGKITRPV